jgi:hypothetical protein
MHAEGGFMRLAMARCDACAGRFTVAHLQRMMWARLCAACARKASGEHRRVDADRSAGAPNAIETPPRLGLASVAHDVAINVVPFAAIGLVAALAHGGLGSFAGGVLWALSLTWFVFALLRAPFDGPAFALECAAQAVCLWIAGRGAVPGAGGVDLALAAGFFVTLIARTLWFGVHLADLAHEDEGLLERSDPSMKGF